MRISDWSSDVCSSDLSFGIHRRPEGLFRRKLDQHIAALSVVHPDDEPAAVLVLVGGERGVGRRWRQCRLLRRVDGRHSLHGIDFLRGRRLGIDRRSEEHTSELQSLMRISYAVFCLKKKKNTQ